MTRPTRLALGRRVASVAAGAHHSLCVCDDGSLWAWGKAADHQLGTRVDDVMAPAPARVRLEGDLRARQVAAGAAHSLAVDADGGLWSWGRNAHGQLGHGTARPSPAPRRVLPLRARPVVQAAAGAFHSLAVLREGALYAFGLGADGRLGLGHQLNATLPEMVPLHQFVRQAAAGATHSACCDSAGCLYTWGDGAKGALGHLGPRPRKNKNDTGLASMPSWESALRSLAMQRSLFRSAASVIRCSAFRSCESWARFQNVSINSSCGPLLEAWRLAPRASLYFCLYLRSWRLSFLFFLRSFRSSLVTIVGGR